MRCARGPCCIHTASSPCVTTHPESYAQFITRFHFSVTRSGMETKLRRRTEDTRLHRGPRSAQIAPQASFPAIECTLPSENDARVRDRACPGLAGPAGAFGASSMLSSAPRAGGTTPLPAPAQARSIFRFVSRAAPAARTGRTTAQRAKCASMSHTSNSDTSPRPLATRGSNSCRKQ